MGIESNRKRVMSKPTRWGDRPGSGPQSAHVLESTKINEKSNTQIPPSPSSPILPSPPLSTRAGDTPPSTKRKRPDFNNAEPPSPPTADDTPSMKRKRSVSDRMQAPGQPLNGSTIDGVQVPRPPHKGLAFDCVQVPNPPYKIRRKNPTVVDAAANVVQGSVQLQRAHDDIQADSVEPESQHTKRNSISSTTRSNLDTSSTVSAAKASKKRRSSAMEPGEPSSSSIAKKAKHLPPPNGAQQPSALATATQRTPDGGSVQSINKPSKAIVNQPLAQGDRDNSQADALKSHPNRNPTSSLTTSSVSKPEEPTPSSSNLPSKKQSNPSTSKSCTSKSNGSQQRSTASEVPTESSTRARKHAPLARPITDFQPQPSPAATNSVTKKPKNSSPSDSTQSSPSVDNAEKALDKSPPALSVRNLPPIPKINKGENSPGYQSSSSSTSSSSTYPQSTSSATSHNQVSQAPAAPSTNDQVPSQSSAPSTVTAPSTAINPTPPTPDIEVISESQNSISPANAPVVHPPPPQSDAGIISDPQPLPSVDPDDQPVSSQQVQMTALEQKLETILDSITQKISHPTLSSRRPDSAGNSVALANLQPSLFNEAMMQMAYIWQNQQNPLPMAQLFAAFMTWLQSHSNTALQSNSTLPSNSTPQSNTARDERAASMYSHPHMFSPQQQAWAPVTNQTQSQGNFVPFDQQQFSAQHSNPGPHPPQQSRYQHPYASAHNGALRRSPETPSSDDASQQWEDNYEQHDSEEPAPPREMNFKPQPQLQPPEPSTPPPPEPPSQAPLSI
ncbi:hypothetical protein H0H92_015201, partial [Tricholoma furcatifolium]